MAILNSLVRRSRHSPFIAAVLILLSGATIAQAVPLLTMPWLAGLYDPAFFSVQALLIVSVGVFTSLSTGSYELAITSAHNRKRAAAIASLAFFLSLLVNVCLFSAIAALHPYMAGLSFIAPLRE